MDNGTSKRYKNTVQNGLPQKKFEARNSILTDLLENVHIRTIYNMMWIIVIASQLSHLIHNYSTNGRLNFHLERFKISFPKILPMFYIWIRIFVASLFPYFGFVLWATIRHKISKLSVQFFDQLSLSIFIAYIGTYTYYFALLIHQNDFYPTSAVALMFELVRLKMKLYAFVRSNVPRAKYGILYPNILKYVYFLFAPTLIYQDEYPRSNSIRWKKVVEHFTNFAGTLFLLIIITEHFETKFVMFNRNPYTWTNFWVIVLDLIPLSGMLFLAAFYLIFECWLNAFAEMLRFSDRLFYKDFWTSTSLEHFYRTWNGIVYDWLYVYIYKDFYETVWPNNKFVARAMVFFVSTLYHQLILAITFNVFLPLPFILVFFISLAVKAISFNNAMGNFCFLLGTAYGTSVIICTYGIDHYSKINNN